MSKITLEDVAVDLDSDVAAGFDLEQRQACAALVRAAAKVVEAVKDLPSDEIVFEGSRCFVVPLEILEAIDAALAAFDKAGEKP